MKLQGYGFHAKYNNKQSMANMLIRLADNNKWKKKMRQAALLAFSKNFSPNIILKNWANVIKDLGSLN